MLLLRSLQQLQLLSSPLLPSFFLLQRYTFQFLPLLSPYLRDTSSLKQESHPEAVAVGIGAAGFVSSNRNTMASGTNLDWTGVRIGDVVAERVGLPVVVENDANAAGWAEARFGAGAGKRNVLVVTLGTGVGGAIVIDGRLVRGAAGFAAEIGHINVEPDGRPCG